MLLNIARVYKISGEDKKMKKKVFGWECLIFILCFCGFFGILISRMGAVNMLNTLLNTAYALLTDTVLYIMAIAVIMGGIAGLCAGCCSLLFQNDGYPERSFAEHRVSDFAG